MLNSEYYVPSVNTDNNKASSITHTIKTIKPQAETIGVSNNQKHSQHPSQRVKSKQSEQPSSKIQKSQQQQQIISQRPSSQQISEKKQSGQQKQSTKKESSVDDYEEYSISQAQGQSRPATAKPDFLQWDIKEVKHEKRDPKFMYKKEGKLQAIENQKMTKTHKDFQNAKITTCSYITYQNGVPLAIPTYQKPKKDFYDQQPKLNYVKSLTQENFQLKQQSKAGDKKKPLEKYNPNSFRSRLPIPDVKIPKKNDSSIKFGPETIGKNAQKGFSTTNQKMVATIQQMQKINVSNPGILAEIQKQMHKRQFK